jgi:hypothetical protein
VHLPGSIKIDGFKFLDLEPANRTLPSVSQVTKFRFEARIEIQRVRT